MTDQSLLAIDCGTQSLRALIFSADGRILARAQSFYEPYVSPSPGLAEQDPDVYWTSLKAACRTLRKTRPDLFRSIAAVGVTSQRNTMVNLDRDGRVLRPAIVWLDQRKAAPVFSRFPVLKRVVRATGLGKKLEQVQAQGKCNWIMQHQPDIWEKTVQYLQVSGFLNHRLTGEFADSTASQIGHLPFCYKKQEWARGFSVSKFLFPVPLEKLPRLVPPGEIIGHVTRRASRQTGLSPGLPVAACGSDKGCETLGAGVIDEKMVSVSFGTTATVQAATRRYFEPLPFMPPYPAPVPGHYNPEVEIFRGFWMISWFKHQFAAKEVAEAQTLGIPAEQVLDRHLRHTAPGAMGLVVQPYWGPGLDHPDAKGAMIGFGDVHTKAHIYRAVIEGLGFALLEGLERMERRGRLKVEKAAVSGGASQSDEICRIFANIFNRPMVKGRTHETSGLGAAIVTAKALGLYPDIQTARNRMVHTQAVFEPDPGQTGIYRRLYRQVYCRMYKALAPLYKNIQHITGYPE